MDKPKGKGASEVLICSCNLMGPCLGTFQFCVCVFFHPKLIHERDNWEKEKCPYGFTEAIHVGRILSSYVH